MSTLFVLFVNVVYGCCQSSFKYHVYLDDGCLCSTHCSS